VSSSSTARSLANPQRLESGVGPQVRAERVRPEARSIVYTVDDDETVLAALRLMLESVGLQAAAYTSAGEFIENFNAERPGCVVLDLWMPDLNGFETLIRLRERDKTIPILFLTGHSDVSAVVRAMRLGAVDFFEKPVNSGTLLESIQRWVHHDLKTREVLHRQQATQGRLATLSRRQRQVLDCVLKGMSNKETARRLGVSPKAIEISRAIVMRKMGAGSVVDLVFAVCGCLYAGDHIECSPPCLQATVCAEDHGRKEPR
jgi:two-component system response regulator FixJ